MTTEKIILRHSSRGMDILKNYLRDDYCSAAAKKIMSLERKNILLTTGFYVAGYAETDGPPGTVFLAKALAALGFAPIILTDKFCKSFFDGTSVPCIYLTKGFDADKILDEFDPTALISIERCGINTENDYANMRGISIAENTVETDRLFDAAREKGLYTLGVGDGGNEIGMGNLKDIISSELSLVPCRTETSDLVIATVSNWGAYALAAELSVLAGKKLLPDYPEIDGYIEYIVSKGSVDGVIKEHIPTVDGFNKDVEKEITDALNKYIIDNINI